MSRTIPMKDWVWDGHAAHLIVGRYCQFHLATRAGDYVISTVGEYRPPKGTRPDGEQLGGEEYAEFESVGLDRLFETYVFHCTGPGFGEISEFNEVDSLSANDHDTANRNHMELCRKYAVLPQPEWRSVYDEGMLGMMGPIDALLAAMELCGVEATEQQAQDVHGSLEKNGWSLTHGPMQPDRARVRGIGGEGETGLSSGLPPED